ncbi:MAG: hypothetical protein KIT31_31260, partial [Deltaproteobacteria bacterium]|nr:hypothetical protein [Deltaproteobacteria bacterium]
PIAAAVAYVGTRPGDVRGEELEAVVAADPDAPGPCEVLGDHLMSAGDVFGELIATGLALAKDAKHKAMRRRWDELQEARRDEIWGALAPHLRSHIGDAEWRNGFVRSCRACDYPLSPLSLADALRALLDEPGPGRFLAALELDDLCAGALEPAFAVLAVRPRPTLRRLALVCHEAMLDPLARLGTALPDLRELDLQVMGLHLGSLAAPRLESLAIDLFDPEEPWNALAAIEPVLAGASAPALRRLTLRSFPDGDELVRRCAETPLLAQLTHLDLRGGTIGEDGAACIRTHRERFAHLEVLALDENYLPDGALADLPRATLADQRPPELDRRPLDWE